MKALKAWIARDENGMLFLYLSKPKKFVRKWIPVASGRKFLQLDEELFPEVKFEEEEATEVKFTIKNNNGTF